VIRAALDIERQCAHAIARRAGNLVVRPAGQS
jgi:hypothetical protein